VLLDGSPANAAPCCADFLVVARKECNTIAFGDCVRELSSRDGWRTFARVLSSLLISIHRASSR
jgi:hypothetical protein